MGTPSNSLRQVWTSASSSCQPNGMILFGRVTAVSGEGHEKQPFLANTEPVRLTPAWEETNLPNDELNFKGVTMEQADLEMNPPKDR